MLVAVSVISDHDWQYRCHDPKSMGIWSIAADSSSDAHRAPATELGSAMSEENPASPILIVGSACRSPLTATPTSPLGKVG